MFICSYNHVYILYLELNELLLLIKFWTNIIAGAYLARKRDAVLFKLADSLILFSENYVAL